MDGAVMRKNRMLGLLEKIGTVKTYTIQELMTIIQRMYGVRSETAEALIRDMIRIGVLKTVKGNKYGGNPLGFY